MIIKKIFLNSFIVMVILMASVSVFAEELVIGYAAPSVMDIAQVAILDGVEKACEEAGVKLISTIADNDMIRQINQSEDLLSRNIDAYIVCPVDANGIVSVVEKANDKNIPVFCVDRSANGGKVELVVECNNVLVGKLAGEQLVSQLKAKYGEPKGVLLELEGQLGTSIVDEFSSGFHSVVDQFPDIKVIQRSTGWLADEAFKITLDVMASNPQLDGIYCHSDCLVPSTIEAIKSIKGDNFATLGEKGFIPVVGDGGVPDSLKLIRNKELLASINMPFEDEGYLVAKYAIDFVKGKAIEPGAVIKEGASWSPAEIAETEQGMFLLTKPTPVTIENVDDPFLWANKAN